jgi:peptidoglycan/LPS O-acetylase OafA/YrhL
VAAASCRWNSCGSGILPLELKWQRHPAAGIHVAAASCRWNSLLEAAAAGASLTGTSAFADETTMTAFTARETSAPPPDPSPAGEGNLSYRPALPLATRQPSTRFLDGLRGLAALYVFIRHASILLYSRPDHPAFLDRLIASGFYSFRFAVAAVYFFFVLSGFVIHLRYSQKLAADPRGATFGWPGFFWRRARRLYPPLLFAIALTFLFDSAGLHLHLPVYQTELVPHRVVTPHLDHNTLLANLAFLANVHLPIRYHGSFFTAKVWGTDAPLWSLTFEWWFYMIYPAFWWLTKKSITLATSVVAIGFALHYVVHHLEHTHQSAQSIHLLTMTLTAFPAWWVGALLADVYAGRIKIPFWSLTPLLMLLPFTAAIPEEGTGDHSLQVIALALAFAGLISLGFALQTQGLKLRPLNALKWLGDMSYTLYLIHMPICVFLGGWLMSRTPQRTLPHTPWIVLLTIVATIAFAWLAHLLVERPFTRSHSRTPRPAASAPGAPAPASMPLPSTSVS